MDKSLEKSNSSFSRNLSSAAHKSKLENLKYKHSKSKPNLIVHNTLLKTSRSKQDLNLFLSTKNNTSSIFAFSNDSMSQENLLNFNDKSLHTQFSNHHIKPLIKMYALRENKNNLNFSLNDENSSEINSIYNIKSDLNNKEKIDIRENLKKGDFKAKLEKSNGQLSVIDEYFSDPYKSLQTIKKNKKIYENIHKIVLNNQISNYKKLVKDEDKFKIGFIPKIKVIAKAKSVKPIFEIINENSNKVFPNIPNRTSVKEKTLKFSKFSISREKVEKCGLQFQGNYFNNVTTKPNSRSQFSLVINNHKLYLFCGLNGKGLNDIWEIELTNEKSYKWKQILPESRSNLNGRYGHTTVSYNNSLYTYGGIVNDSLNINRDVLESLVIFDSNKEEYRYQTCSNRREIRYRRNHICELVGTHMLVQGGIDEDFKVLNDAWFLDLIEYKWNKVDARGNLPSLAYHSSTLVLNSVKKLSFLTNLYRFPENNYALSHEKKIKFEGIYIFGGLDEEMKPTNELRLIKIGKKPLDIMVINQKGEIPSKRASSTLTFYENLNVLILFGGKNNETGLVFQDLFLFDLDIFYWTKVQIYDEPPLPRCEHCSVVYENKLIIFGGIGASEYINSDLYVLSLDSSSEFNFNFKSIRRNNERLKTKIFLIK